MNTNIIHELDFPDPRNTLKAYRFGSFPGDRYDFEIEFENDGLTREYKTIQIDFYKLGSGDFRKEIEHIFNTYLERRGLENKVIVVANVVPRLSQETPIEYAIADLTTTGEFLDQLVAYARHLRIISKDHVSIRPYISDRSVLKDQIYDPDRDIFYLQVNGRDEDNALTFKEAALEIRNIGLGYYLGTLGEKH